MATRKPRAPWIKCNVTQEIIDAAIPRDSKHCMIAEAVRAAYPDAQNVDVDLQTVRLSDPKKGYRFIYLTPRVGQVALVEFDREVIPEPFSFLLRAGQVVPSGARPKPADYEDLLDPKEKEARSAAAKKGRQSQLTPPTLKLNHSEHSGALNPERIGGRSPPIARDKNKIPFNRRRAFGLRALER